MKESREAYLSKDGLGAWQEPPDPPSSSSSGSTVSASSSPGIDKEIKGGTSSASAPAVLDIDSYHAHHVPDCRQSQYTEKEDDVTCSDGTIDK